MKKNKKHLLNSILISLATLFSCSKEFIKYPSDYNVPLFANIQKFAWR